jgi:hypothetical protein
MLVLGKQLTWASPKKETLVKIDQEPPGMQLRPLLHRISSSGAKTIEKSWTFIEDKALVGQTFGWETHTF